MTHRSGGQDTGMDGRRGAEVLLREKLPEGDRLEPEFNGLLGFEEDRLMNNLRG